MITINIDSPLKGTMGDISISFSGAKKKSTAKKVSKPKVKPRPKADRSDEKLASLGLKLMARDELDDAHGARFQQGAVHRRRQ